MGVDLIQYHMFFPLVNTQEFNKIDDYYFDKSECDFSILYNDKIFSNSVLGIIKSNVENFSCFYTFDSNIRQNYARMDLLIACFSAYGNVYKKGIDYLISQYGLKNMYTMFKEELEQAYKILYTRTIKEYFYSQKEKKVLYNVLQTMFNYVSRKDDNIYLNECIRFGNIIFSYISHTVMKEKIVAFYLDVLDENQTASSFSEEITFYKFSRNKTGCSFSKLKVNLK